MPQLKPETLERIRKFQESDKFKTLRPETQERIVGLLGQSVEPQAVPNKPFLPGREAMLQKQAERMTPVEQVKQSVSERPKVPENILRMFIQATNPTNPILGQLAVPAGKAAGVGARATESAVAGPALAVQEGRAGDVGKEFVKGVTGQSKAEIGDVYRQSGIPEPIAAALGLGTDMALGARIAKAAPTIAKVSGQIGKFVDSKLPKFMNDKWLLQRSKQVWDIADDAGKVTSKRVAAFYEPYAETPVNRNRMQDIINKMSGGARDEGIDLMQQIQSKLGTVKTNIADAKVLKDIVQDYVPEGVWSRGKRGMDMRPSQRKLVEAYGELRQLIRDSLPDDAAKVDFDRINSNATEVYRLSKAVKRLVTDQTGKPTEAGRLVAAYGKKGNIGKRDILKRLGEIDKRMKQVETDMQKYDFRQKLKGVMRKAAVGYAIYEGGKRAIGAIE